MATLSFDYHEFFWHFTHAGTVTEDVIVQALEADYVAMKYDRTGAQAAFRQRNMLVRKMDLLDDDHAPLGVFTVFPEGANPRKFLYMVCPCLHEGRQSSFLKADHYSFLINRGSRERPLHFHKTKYVPYDDHDGQEGFCGHFPSHLPLAFETTRQAFPGLLHRALQQDVRFLFRVFQEPWLDGRMRARESEGAQLGGARVRRRRRRQQQEPVADLNDAFRRLPLHRVLVMAVRNEGQATFDVTVFLHDRLRHALHLRQACSIRGVPQSGVRDPETGRLGRVLEARLVERLARMEWGDFRDALGPGEP